MDPIIARKTWRTLEPYHGLVYFAAEPADRYAALGIEGQDGYFASRAAAYSLLIVGISEIPGVEDHAAAILDALAPWVGGHRLPNFTFTPEEYVDAYGASVKAALADGRELASAVVVTRPGLGRPVPPVPGTPSGASHPPVPADPTPAETVEDVTT